MVSQTIKDEAVKLSKKARTAIAALVISTAGVTGVVMHEGFRDTAYIPVKGDVPTIGFGSTTYADGSRVKLGDKLSREDATKLLGNKISSFERELKKCVKVPLFQYEYDAFVSLSYNIGSSAFCNSTLVKKVNAYDYEGACKEILKWDKFQGKPLPGLTKRRTQEYQQCLGLSPNYSLTGK